MTQLPKIEYLRRYFVQYDMILITKKININTKQSTTTSCEMVYWGSPISYSLLGQSTLPPVDITIQAVHKKEQTIDIRYKFFSQTQRVIADWNSLPSND